MPKKMAMSVRSQHSNPWSLNISWLSLTGVLNKAEANQDLLVRLSFRPYKKPQKLTGDALHEDEAAQNANEDGHERASSHVERVARVCLQRAPLQHAVLVPEVRRVRPAAHATVSRP